MANDNNWDGVTPEQLMAAISAHPGMQQATGPQPSIGQTIAASPVGRFAHDTARGFSDLANMIGPKAPNALDALGLEKPYQAAIAAQQNRPGYVEQRALADKMNQGSGITDQLTPGIGQLVSGIGGFVTGGLSGMNAQQDSRAAAQNAYRAQNPLTAIPANLAGGLLLAPEAGTLPAAAASTAKQIAPTLADLRTGYKAAYKAVDNSGVRIAGLSYDNMVSDLVSKYGDRIDPILHPNATQAMNRLTQLQSKAAGGTGAAVPAPIPFHDVLTLREIANDAAGTPIAKDAHFAGAITDHIDDYLNNLGAADVAGPKIAPTQTIADLNNARDLYSRAKQVETIQSVLDKADIKATANYSQSGAENSIRAGFKQLALNDRQMARLSPDVQDAVIAVAKGSPITNVLRNVGKYAPHGPVAAAAGAGLGSGFGAMAGGLAGAAGGSGIGAVALPLIGEAARTAATARTTAAAQRALDAAALGKTAAAIPANPALQLPSLTARSAIPYGLFNSAMQLQNQ